MTRQPGTTREGSSFTAQTINSVWSKAQVVAGYDAAEYRKDRCGAWIQRDAYGDTKNKWGWEIDHELPVSKGGTDDLSNLEPLHWENNRHKGDDYPNWSCKRTE